MRWLKRLLFRTLFRKERSYLLDTAYSYNVNWESDTTPENAAAFDMLRRCAEMTWKAFEQQVDPKEIFNLKPVQVRRSQ